MVAVVAFAGTCFSADRILSAAAVNSCPRRTFAFLLSVADAAAAAVARIHYDYEYYC